jgi:hypothetical protein
MDNQSRAMSIDFRLVVARDCAVDARGKDTFPFLERLVAAPSTVGATTMSKSVVTGELDHLRRGVTRIPLPNVRFVIMLDAVAATDGLKNHTKRRGAQHANDWR